MTAARAPGTTVVGPGFIESGERPQIVTSRFKYDDSYTIDRYHATGGYRALKLALTKTPTQVHDEVRGATLLGRGGAGFPAGVKWGLMPPNVFPRYLVVNGDERLVPTRIAAMERDRTS